MKRLVVLLALVLAPLALAQELPSLLASPVDCQSVYKIDLGQALERGISTHPSLRAAHARADSAYWQLQKASSFPSTQVTIATIPGSVVAGSQPGGNNPSGAGAGFATFAANGQTDTYVQVTQPFDPLGSYSARQEVALHEYRLAVANWKSTEVHFRKQVKDAFYGLLIAQEMLKVVHNNLALAEEGYAIAEKRSVSGAGPRLDLIDSGVQRSRAQQDVVRAQANLKQAQAVLAPLLNLPGQSQIEGEGALDLPTLDQNYEKLLDLARVNPRIQAASSALEQSRAAVTLAEQQSNPTPLLTFLRDITTHTYQVQVGLQFPIDWGQIGNEVRSKAETVVEQEQNLQATRLALSSDLKVAFEQYLGALQNASAFRQSVLLPSQESTRITQYGFKRGAIPYVRLLTSQQNLSNVSKEYLVLLQSVFLALHALEAAAGQPLVLALARNPQRLCKPL